MTGPSASSGAGWPPAGTTPTWPGAPEPTAPAAAAPDPEALPVPGAPQAAGAGDDGAPTGEAEPQAPPAPPAAAAAAAAAVDPADEPVERTRFAELTDPEPTDPEPTDPGSSAPEAAGSELTSTDRPATDPPAPEPADPETGVRAEDAVHVDETAPEAAPEAAPETAVTPVQEPLSGPVEAAVAPAAVDQELTPAVAPEEPALSPEPAPTVVPESGPARTGGRVLVPVLAALVAVLTGLTAFLGVQAARTAGADPLDARRAEALSAARESARLVFSYDYRHLAKDFAAGKAVTTGDFAKEYERTTGKLVQDVAPRYKAVVSADVSEASVVQAADDEVVCLVFVNQSSTSSLATTPKITQSRLEMTLQRRGDRWLVAKIKAL